VLVPTLLGAVKVASAIHALRRCPIGSAKRIRHVILGQQGNDVKYFTIPGSASPKGAPLSGLESGFGTFETCRLHRAMSEFESKAENICSY
jgi:hypothetical protein